MGVCLINWTTFRGTLPVVLSSLLIISCGGSGGSSAVGSDKLLESEFNDSGNWTVYETYDRSESGPIVSALVARAAPRSVKREKIVTYTANGLVAESFHYLAATADSIAMGNRYYGISMLSFDDLDAPKGKVYNCRQSALHGLVADQDRFYAWAYDSSIVDARTCEVIYDDAPMGTKTGFGAIPKNRLIIQNGDFFIGTSNLDANGNVPTDVESDMSNGLWIIDAALSGSTQLIDHPVWCLYQDSTDTIWAGTQDGIYRQNNDVFERIQNGYVEQFFEFNGEIYALIKDFFHKPADENDFDLYRWDGAAFQYVCEASSVDGDNGESNMHVFVWNSTLYITNGQTSLLAFNGSTFSLQEDPIYDGKMGQYNALAANDKLFTVGNLTGLNIWDGVDYTQLNTVNTAEGLLSNDIQVLHVHSQGSLWVGSPVSGFSMLDEEGNFTSLEVVEQVSIGGIFEHDGTTYIQGANTVYAMGFDDLQAFADFSCNGERVYYDASHGKLWATPNFSDVHNGALGMLDMNTLQIWGTTGDDDRENYWQRDYTWEKPPFHFNEVVAIPDEDAVFIALENGNGTVLRYDYLTGAFSEVAIPIAAIRHFDITDKAVFGVGQGSIVTYEKGNWTVVIGDLFSDYPIDLVVKNQYAFVPSADHLEVAHLVSGKTSLWGFDELPISGRIQTIAMRTNQAPGVINKAYAMIFGTNAGLAICNLNLK